MNDTSTLPRKKAEREIRQRFILEAARRLFVKKGIDETSMDSIARASDYTRRTLYTYFVSRDDILLRIHTENLATRWSYQKRALAGVDDTISRIRIWAETLHSFWQQDPHIMRLEQYWDYRGIDPSRIDEAAFSKFRTLNNELADYLREIFRSGREDGSLRSDLDVDLCISIFIETLRRTIYRSASTTYSITNIEGEAYVNYYLDIFIRGICKEEEGKAQ